MGEPRVSLSGVSGVVALIATLLVAPKAAAEQPTTVAGLLAYYYDLSNEAEQISEELLVIQESLSTQRKASDSAKAAADEARVVAEVTRRRANAMPDLDRMAHVLAKRSGTDVLSAFMDSTSPGDLLDRLDGVTLVTKLTSTDTVVDKTLAEAEQAADAANAAEAAAEQAEAQVADRVADVQGRQAALNQQISEVRTVLDQLTPEQRSLLAGPDDAGGETAAPDGSVGGMLTFALAQRGKPYLWGAVGPNAYDCSGLVLASFRTVGIKMPRVSRQQATVGQAISRSEVQAGDLVFYYQPVHHVAIAVDNMRAVHASSVGEPVKISAIDAIGPITVIRRVVG